VWMGFSPSELPPRTREGQDGSSTRGAAALHTQ
jgi:hypothetical protein